jgi:hypothetical protein
MTYIARDAPSEGARVRDGDVKITAQKGAASCATIAPMGGIANEE